MLLVMSNRIYASIESLFTKQILKLCTRLLIYRILGLKLYKGANFLSLNAFNIELIVSDKHFNSIYLFLQRVFQIIVYYFALFNLNFIKH